MSDLIADLKKQEAWLKKTGTKNVEFSNVLDIFRDERELIATALAEIERLKEQIKDLIIYGCDVEDRLAKAKDLLEVVAKQSTSTPKLAAMAREVAKDLED